LGQVRTDIHSNEITAIPELLRLIDIRGARVTIDAEGCQKGIAEQIIEKGADYTLALKENQEELYRQVKECFEWKESDKWADAASDDSKTGYEKDHGRIEMRECSVISDIDWLYQKSEWKNIKSIIKVRCHSEKWEAAKQRWGEETVFDRYFISSLALSAKEMAVLIRHHWSIENNLHWVLDVVFGEDDDMKKTLHAPENMNILRKTSLACIRRHESEKKKSFNYYRREALLDDNYSRSLLFETK
jgi:predicted transposase YbfD/YdcC